MPRRRRQIPAAPLRPDMKFLCVVVAAIDAHSGVDVDVNTRSCSLEQATEIVVDNYSNDTVERVSCRKAVRKWGRAANAGDWLGFPKGMLVALQTDAGSRHVLSKLVRTVVTVEPTGA